jgi:hypothetical protein
VGPWFLFPLSIAISCELTIAKPTAELDNRHLILLLNRTKYGKIKIHAPRQPYLFFP